MRKRPKDRFVKVIENAGKVFALNGYRQTQMADVAKAMGLSTGTLYLYVESKEALFDLVLRHTVTPGEYAEPPELPVKTPEKGSTFSFLRKVLEHEAHLPSLESALDIEHPKEPRAEFEQIIGEYFARLCRFRVGFLVLARSARDWPELGDLFLGEPRRILMSALTRYIERRTATGHFREMPDTTWAAVHFHESCMFWAAFRYTDPAYPELSDEKASEIVTDALAHVFLAEP